MNVWHLATTNPGKVADWDALLVPRGVHARAIPDLVQIEEVGDTPEEVAIQKALASSMPGWVLADDVGLWVDALDGRPGLHLKRWATSLGGWAAARGELGRLAGSGAEFRIGVALTREGVVVASATAITRGTLCVAHAEEPGVEPCFWHTGAPAALPLLSDADRDRFHYRHRALHALIDTLAHKGVHALPSPTPRL